MPHRDHAEMLATVEIDLWFLLDPDVEYGYVSLR